MTLSGSKNEEIHFSWHGKFLTYIQNPLFAYGCGLVNFRTALGC